MPDNDALTAFIDGFTNVGRDGVRSAGRALSGVDPATGDAVPAWERLLTLLGGALPVGGAGRAAAGRSAAAMIAGRGADGVERGLTSAQVERLAGLLTEGVSDVPAAALAAGEVGALAYRLPAAGRGAWSPAGHLRPEAMRIELSNGLDAAMRSRVLAHETGHAVDQTAGLSANVEVAPAGVTAGLQKMSQRYRPEAWESGPNVYAADPGETVADAIALYLIDPALAKRLAPDAAAWVRSAANRDDQVRRHVIFNTRPAVPPGLLNQETPP